jgi:hypothetical protein
MAEPRTGSGSPSAVRLVTRVREPSLKTTEMRPSGPTARPTEATAAVRVTAPGVAAGPKVVSRAPLGWRRTMAAAEPP